MPIEFHCDNCNKLYRVSSKLAGKHAKCSCGVKLTIPDSASIIHSHTSDTAKNQHIFQQNTDEKKVGAKEKPLYSPPKYSNDFDHVMDLVGIILRGAIWMRILSIIHVVIGVTLCLSVAFLHLVRETGEPNTDGAFDTGKSCIVGILSIWLGVIISQAVRSLKNSQKNKDSDLFKIGLHKIAWYFRLDVLLLAFIIFVSLIHR